MNDLSDELSQQLHYMPPAEARGLLAALTELLSACAGIQADATGALQEFAERLSLWKLPAPYARAGLLCMAQQYSLPRPDFTDTAASAILEAVQRLLVPATRASDNSRQRKVAQCNRLRRLFDYAYTDLNIALLALAIHVTRMNRSAQEGEEAQQLLAEDNETIYLPLMEMFGCWHLHNDMGAKGLKILLARGLYADLENIALPDKEGQRFYERVKPQLNWLSDDFSTARVELRPNNIFNLYQRLRNGQSQSELARRLKIVITVADASACDRITPQLLLQFDTGLTLVEYQYKDLISGTPKFNGYQSRRVSITYRSEENDTERQVEFYIVSQSMADINTYGLLAERMFPSSCQAHPSVWWKDKSAAAAVIDQGTGTVNVSLYVYSPTGKIFWLPVNSTPVDYAYAVHPDVGNHCRRMFVNGVPVHYDRELANGDLVELQVAANHYPPIQKWLEHAKTSRAKEQIKKALSKRKVQSGKDVFRAEFQKELKHYKLPLLSDEVTERYLTGVARHYRYSSVKAMYIDIAARHYLEQQTTRKESPSVQDVVARVIGMRLWPHLLSNEGTTLPVLQEEITLHRCTHSGPKCRVLFNQPVIGRIINEVGWPEKLILYRADCPDATTDKAMLQLKWRFGTGTGEYKRIHIEAQDSDWLFRTALEQVYDLYNEGVFLLKAEADVRGSTAYIQLVVNVTNPNVVNQLEDKLTQLVANRVFETCDVEALTPEEQAEHWQKRGLLQPITIPNPYTRFPAVQRTFKGREREIRELLDWVRNTNIAQRYVVLYGISRIGKTTLLKHLEAILDTLVNQKVAPVFVDLQILRSPEQFWRYTANAIYLKNQEYSIYRCPDAPEQETFGYDEFVLWMRVLLQQNPSMRWLLMFDEFNVMETKWRNHKETQNVVDDLKNLLEVNSVGMSERINVILCVQQYVYREAQAMVRQSQFSQNSEVFCGFLQRAFAPLELGPLEDAAAEQLIREPTKGHLHLAPEISQCLCRLTGCHPYFLNILLYNLVRIATTGNLPVINPNHLKTLLSETLHRSGSDFSYYIGETQGNRKQVFHALAEVTVKWDSAVGLRVPYNSATINTIVHHLRATLEHTVNAQEVREIMEKLEEVGVVTRLPQTTPAQFRISVPLFGAYILMRQ